MKIGETVGNSPLYNYGGIKWEGGINVPCN